MDNNGQLINYIVQELKRGVPEANIRSTLLQNGWPAEPVQRAFTILQQNEAAAASAASQGTLPAVQQAIPQQSAQPAALPGKPAGKASHTRTTKLSYKKPLIVAGIVFAVVAVGIGAFLLFNRPMSPEQRDTTRKDTLSSLADELTMFYSSQGTYPTREQINSSGFAASEDGFDTKTFRDPSWNDNKECKNEGGTAAFASARTEGCFAYRVTARNGADCKGNEEGKCSRAILTATLESGDPYIITLDQNDKQEY